MMLSRRLFCLILVAVPTDGALAAGVAPYVGLAVERETDLLDRWLAVVTQRDAAERIGRRALDSLSGETIRALLHEQNDHLARHTVAPARTALRALMAADFRSGRTILIDGFLLSKTEASLFVRAAQQTGA